MLPLSRRAFLGASLAGLASGRLLGAQQPTQPARPDDEQAAFQPSTLFLTWQRDPTTTMTVQWVGTRGETADTTIYYGMPADEEWSTKATITKPYAETDFKVFRAELTGLKPGTDY